MLYSNLHLLLYTLRSHWESMFHYAVLRSKSLKGLSKVFHKSLNVVFFSTKQTSSATLWWWFNSRWNQESRLNDDGWTIFRISLWKHADSDITLVNSWVHAGGKLEISGCGRQIAEEMAVSSEPREEVEVRRWQDLARSCHVQDGKDCRRQELLKAWGIN